MPSAQTGNQRFTTLLLLAAISVLGFFSYVYGYHQPAAFFWDENYHVASAQKYLNGVYFMEQHPPLGKLFIALGEAILDRNDGDSDFIGTDYGTRLPPDFSFAGYRLFPVLFAWLTGPVLFLIFLLLLRNPLWSALLSLLYVFDNALIVHLRGAMLEPMLLFFCATTILAYLCLIEWRDQPRRFAIWSALFGVSVALALTTKVVGLVMIVLIPPLLLKLWPSWERIRQWMVLSLLGFLVTYIGVWQVHFALGRTVNPVLPDEGYYQASETYKQLLETGQHRSLLYFPIMLRDSLKFVGHYNKGVPRLDLSKSEENGSPFFLWPLGARSINYRWETPEGTLYQYLYLQVNPAVWWTAFAGVLLAFAIIVGSFVLPVREKPARLFHLVIFFGLYASYMLAIAQIDRVMYLYHYFLPLLFSFLLLGLAVAELRQAGRLRLNDGHRTGILLVIALLVFAGYQFYRPLSHYEPISDEQFQRRMIFPWWELRCVNCPRHGMFATPSDS